MDEVDKLFTAPFASDFFGLVRSWHNSHSTEPHGPWGKLIVLIAYATEAHLFIQDLNQSPFNVGRRLELEDFNLHQFVDLNGRYGGPLKSYAEAERLHALIGGQPFLSRRALDVLATGKWDFEGLMEQGDRDDGPFSDHLKRILVAVSRLPEVFEYIPGARGGRVDARTESGRVLPPARGRCDPAGPRGERRLPLRPLPPLFGGPCAIARGPGADRGLSFVFQTISGSPMRRGRCC